MTLSRSAQLLQDALAERGLGCRVEQIVTEALDVLVDEGLLAQSEIRADAGTPNAVFRLSPPELVALTDGRVVPVTR